MNNTVYILSKIKLLQSIHGVRKRVVQNSKNSPLYLRGFNGQVHLLVTDVGPELYALQCYLVNVALHGLYGDLHMDSIWMSQWGRCFV